jgi:hypothetical protein
MTAEHRHTKTTGEKCGHREAKITVKETKNLAWIKLSNLLKTRN